MIKKISLFGLLLSCFLLSGCFGTSGVSGVFKSQDNGSTWESRVFLEEGKRRPVTIANVEITDMVFGYDNKVMAPEKIYIATTNSGAYKSFDGAGDWDSLNLGKNYVTAIAVSSTDENVIYAAIDRQILKTVNGGQDWFVSYLSATAPITTVRVDSFDPNRVYAGTTQGELVRSMDGGNSWTLIKRFEVVQPITEILINPKDTRKVYVFFAHNGIWKTTQGDRQNPEFISLQQNITGPYNADRPGALSYQSAALDVSKSDSIVYASRYGLIRSDDGGQTWHDLNIVFNTQTNPIVSIGINPTNGKGMYLGTISAVYKTDDGGKSWATIPPPSVLAPAEILVDPKNPNTVYLGVRNIKVN